MKSHEIKQTLADATSRYWPPWFSSHTNYNNCCLQCFAIITFNLVKRLKTKLKLRIWLVGYHHLLIYVIVVTSSTDNINRVFRFRNSLLSVLINSNVKIQLPSYTERGNVLLWKYLFKITLMEFSAFLPEKRPFICTL